MHYVYILKNLEDGTLYKGYTSDIDRRLKEHQQNSTRTTARKPGDYELIWYCMFPTKTQAIQF
ncbi:GIY-YIG nuclease family protein [Candidatus Uhrbacteria bacterium]|nr:GIY-YIG nuclease family protein [Candidatus Uhrbacteria bacterium]